MIQGILNTAIATFLVAATGASGAEVTILCTLDDAQSQQFCKQDTLAATACQLTYAIDDSTQGIRELNPSRILPAFSVRSWNSTALHVVRKVEIPGSKVSQTIGTDLNRLTGLLVQWSIYVNIETNESLSETALSAFEAERVKQFGLWGYLERSTKTATCKAIQPAIPNSASETDLTAVLLAISRSMNINLPLKIDNEKILDVTVVVGRTLIIKYRFTDDRIVNDPRFSKERYVSALRESTEKSTCRGSLEVLRMGAEYNYHFVNRRGLEVIDFTLDARACENFLARK